MTRNAFEGCRNDEERKAVVRALIDEGRVVVSHDGSVKAKTGCLEGVGRVGRPVHLPNDRLRGPDDFHTVYSNDLASYVGGRAGLIELGEYCAARMHIGYMER